MVAHNCHGKRNNLAAKEKRLTAKENMQWGHCYFFCREVFPFAVSLLLSSWGYSFYREVILLSRGFIFCRKSFTFIVRLFFLSWGYSFVARFFLLPWVFYFHREVILFIVRLFFCREVLSFAVSLFLFCRKVFSFAVSLVRLLRGYFFCRDSYGPPHSIPSILPV